MPFAPQQATPEPLHVIPTAPLFSAGGVFEPCAGLGLVHQVREHMERANDKAYQGREALHLRLCGRVRGEIGGL